MFTTKISTAGAQRRLTKVKITTTIATKILPFTPPHPHPRPAMLPQWIIEKKRDKQALSEEEIRFFVKGYTDGSIPDYQMAALAMAIYLNGMTFEETATLTDAMMRSGDLVDTSSISLPKVDKHSTGGIGDKVSLVLGPLVACCGVAVPMISGRGLGITGGTLDKLESIPGYRTDLSDREFVGVVEKCGVSITGQTGQLAPADKKLYALRDVTATVPSIPLIVASIMSKKLAEGVDALVMDVKWGSGAFMQTYNQAQDLAQNLVEVGRRMGKGMAAVITDMNQPLGHTAGNTLEILETIDCLRGKGPEDIMEVTMALSAHMLILAGVASDELSCLKLLQEKLDSGAALEKFAEMVALHGGDASVIEDPDKLERAPLQRTLKAPRAGYIAKVDAQAIGRACIVLGAGRSRTDDAVDPRVGASDLVKICDRVERGQTIAVLHGASEKALDEAAALASKAFKITDESVLPPALIRNTILPRS